MQCERKHWTKPWERLIVEALASELILRCRRRARRVESSRTERVRARHGADSSLKHLRRIQQCRGRRTALRRQDDRLRFQAGIGKRDAVSAALREMSDQHLGRLHPRRRRGAHRTIGIEGAKAWPVGMTRCELIADPASRAGRFHERRIRRRSGVALEHQSLQCQCFHRRIRRDRLAGIDRDLTA